MNKSKEEIEELVNDISHEICISWKDYQKFDEPSFTDRIKQSDLLIINLLAQETKELKDYKKWFFEEQKRADDLRMELEKLNVNNKELKDEIEMKTNYYEDKLESRHIASSEYYKETQLLKDEIERLNECLKYYVDAAKFRSIDSHK
jgi:hypothetical protein